MRNLLLSFAALLALGACASAPVKPPTSDMAAIAAQTQEAAADTGDTKLADFTTEDVQLALDDANAHQDVIAAQCYTHLLTIIPQIGDGLSTPPKGVVSTFQKARDVIKRGQQGISDEFKINCGPLYLDAKDDIRGLAGKLAGLALKLGVKGFSGGLL